MTDKQFLLWIYNRMIEQYKVPPGYDYMLRLRRIIASMRDDPATTPAPNVEDIVHRMTNLAVHVEDCGKIIDEEGEFAKSCAQDLRKLAEEVRQMSGQALPNQGQAPQPVTPDPEIARIKQVLGTLIGWLQIDLGEANVRKLLEDLNK